MGEITDMILDGTLDQYTGEYINGRSPGYPRSIGEKRQPNAFFGVMNFLKKKSLLTNQTVYMVMKDYFKSRDIHGVNAREPLPNLDNKKKEELAEEISKDFGHFVRWIKEKYNV